MYTLKEIAERWNKSENDILRMAGNNDLQVWTYVDFYGFDYEKIFDYEKTLDGSRNATVGDCQDEQGVREMKFGKPFTKWVHYSYDEKFRYETNVWIGDCSCGNWVKRLARVPCQYLPGLIVNETINTNFFYGDTDLIVYMALEENFMAMYHRKIDIPPSKKRFVSVEKKALCVKVNEVKSMEDKHPELVAGVADNLQKDIPLLEGMKDETPDTISATWQDVTSNAGMSRGTFQVWAKKAGVQWKDEEDELRITLKDILKVKSFRDKTKKEQKKK